MDYLSKELVGSYDWSDFNEERSATCPEIIKGRTYIKTGKYCSTAFVGDVYDMHLPSDEQFKYIMFIGMSRQHPNEHTASRTEGIEVASINAKMEPVATIKFITYPTYQQFKNIVEGYLASIPTQFIRTREEREFIKFEKTLDLIANNIDLVINGRS